MAASDVPDPFARPGAIRLVTIERLERRMLCADAGAPAGFIPVAPDARIYQFTMNGEIAPAGDQDFFALGRLVAGDVVTIGLPAAGSERGTLRDGLIELYQANANPSNPTRVDGNDDGGSARDALMFRHAIAADGTYFIKAGPFSERTGTYALAVQLDASPASPVTSRTGAHWNESEPNGTAVTANDASAAWRRINYVSSQPGNVGATPATRTGEHTYSLRAGDLVTVAVDSVSELDATVALVDDSGSEVFALDHGDGFRGAGDKRDATILAYRVPRSGVYRARVGGNNQTVGAYRIDVSLSRGESAVVGRYVFYNNTVYDGRSPAPGRGDDAAVAPDKVALLPYQPATLANVTNFSGGINGVMIDVAGLQAEWGPTDFDFAMSTPGGWIAAPAPAAVSRRAGAGINASDRITLTWPDGAIVDRWLRVTVKATDATGLPADDVFLFGNLVGETGDDPAATVTVADVMRVRAALGASAGITSSLDFNRDGRINALDHAAARGRVSRGLPFFTATPTVSAPFPDLLVISARPRVSAARRSLYDMIIGAR